ncbi:40S ribosomal protein S27, partial [Thalictrum thalictroides]
MSSIKDDEQEEEEEFKDSETRKHQSVVLIPPHCSSSGESSPCEIKLSFEQRHEIRQVYVRSTARVFEIYYATGSQSDNEYLCTVRCGIAAKEDAPLSASATEEDTSVHSEGSTEPKELLEEKTRSESNSSTNDDGWVEIKVPDSALLHSKTSSVAKCIERNTERNIQDFYEATAEINDSIPCISITLRLLSLHTKGCINLEEIYIYGEPVDPTDCDDKMDPLKRSSESSMMAMFVPTLLQLSKTGMLKRIEDKQVAEVRQGLKCQNDESPGSYMGGTMQKEAQSSLSNREEVDLQAAVKESSESARIQSNEPDQGTGKRTESVNYIDDSSSGRVERVLDQLVSRIGRIEAFCSRFEENMLKPISNIETRLERLEQKLEGLTMQSQSSYMHPCTRITAPDFSCIESETHSLQNDENENNGYRMSDFASNGTTFTRLSVCNSDEMESKFPLKDKNGTQDVESGSFINNDASDSEVVPQLVPGLIITAPEFSSEDDNDDGVQKGNDMDCNDDFVASKMGFPVNKSSLSIDDAVAMALAGFMSFASTPNSPGAINDKEVPRMSSSSNSSTDAVIRNCLIQEEGIVGSCDETSSNKIKDKEVPRMSLSSNSSTDAVIRTWKTPQVNQGQVIMFPSDDSTDSDKTEGEVNRYKLEDTTNGFTSLKANGEEVTRLPHDDSTEARFRGDLLQEGKYGGCTEMSVNQIITGNSHEMQGEVNLYKSEDTTNRFAPLKFDSNLNVFDDDVQKSFIANPGTWQYLHLLVP